MNSDDFLSFMDLLDLDEDLVDSRLKYIMLRKSFTNKHLVSAIYLLEYKHLINVKEDTECENEDEYNFIVKLISSVHTDNIENVCKIINIVLSLNKVTIVSKSEHLIQQILSSDIYLPLQYPHGISIDNSEDEKTLQIRHCFRLCESIIDSTIKCGKKISLPFLETPLENVLTSSDDKLKIYFLTSTVPRLFAGVNGYDIFGRIWNFLKQSQEEQLENTLRILSCLSEFYLPISDSKGNVKLESEIMLQYEFWSLLLSGLSYNDSSVRKLSVYLMKRAIDCLIIMKKEVSVNDEQYTLFSWKLKNEKQLKQLWDNFFILIESLEEKQSNIVLPSLQLIDTLDNLQNCWINCAFNIGLKHDNTEVRQKCIEYRLQRRIDNKCDALTLLEALNKVNIYDHPKEIENLKQKLISAFEDDNFVHIFKSIAKVMWSPVALYHLTVILSEIKLKLGSIMSPTDISNTVIDILKLPCNNIPMRKAVHINISYFVGNSCKNLHWRELLKMYSSFQRGIFSSEIRDKSPFMNLIKNARIDDNEISEFFIAITHSYMNIDFALLYLDYKNTTDIMLFLSSIDKNLDKVQDIISRPYSDTTECLDEVLFFIYLFSKTKQEHSYCEEISHFVAGRCKVIIQYLMTLLASERVLNIKDMDLLFNGLNAMSTILNNYHVTEVLLQMYQSAVLILKDKNTEIDKKLFCVFILDILQNNLILLTHYNHEMLNLTQILEGINTIEYQNIQNKESVGRLRNVFYGKSCEIVYNLLEEREIKRNIKEIINFIENVTECGGYGCLKWILKIMNKVLPILLIHEESSFDTIQFIDRMWREIEELKSNNQYSPCIEEFVNLITQDVLLKKAMYNNIVIFYCSKIIEIGPVKNTPLFYLVRELNNMDIISEYGQIIYVLCEILLYSPVPRKDQRIAENIAIQILLNPMYAVNKDTVDNDVFFNFEIRFLSISILTKIANEEMYDIIATFVIKNLEETLKNKQRYHENSQVHRLLLIGIQHLIFISLLNLKTITANNILSWCIDLLGKLPHQPSVRICLEWYISLNLFMRKENLNELNMQKLTSKNIPMMSQLTILFWLLKHKIANGTFKKEEFEFVMDLLLSHTMGQSFNMRLYSQYLATKLIEMNKSNSQKYTNIIEVIEKTLAESSDDKNFVKLKEDYFLNTFDIFSNLTPCFIYYFLPRYLDIGSNECVDENYIRTILKHINENLTIADHDNDLKKEWITYNKSDEDMFTYFYLNSKTESNKLFENANMARTIQKKYIPWKNMSDIDVYYKTVKKRESQSELIVVASLIDKLPNLGGMARTSEVFGVKTYAVDSLRHLQDKQFQGLSVSAERWVNIEEVRPGPRLKDYLMSKKVEGYVVVAAEQTSTSSPLQTFKFPKKTLLLLGHEKEGIPGDLLPLMDHCVEIPQQGFVRSLNVHVTAAIFVWEYTRQNIL